MSVSIKNIPFSFFQFGTDSCTEPLPVQNESDLKFQAQLTTDEEGEADEVLSGADIELFVVKNVSTIESDGDINTNKIGDGTPVGAGIAWKIDDNTVGAYWSSLFSDFEAIGLGVCFRFVIRVTEDGGSKFYFLSNCFIRVVDEYTSTIQYSCEEDSYGFSYCDRSVPNKVRLPFFLSRPQYKTDRAVYFKSDGSARITKSITRKEFDGMTDHLSNELHQKITTALEHESIFIESEQYVGDVAKSGNYDINWTDHNEYHYASATFKVNAVPFNATLNNCAECKEDEPECDVSVVVLNADISGGRVIVTWAAQSGTPSGYSVGVDDGEPEPTEVSSYESDVLLPGEHEFVITPYCTVNGKSIAGPSVSVTITIPDEEEECVPVGYGSFSLPDARVDEAYSFATPITGTLPITISTANKPAWLSISVVGNMLVFTGTPYPGSEGNNIVVFLILNNCFNPGFEPVTESVTVPINVISAFGAPVSGIRIHQYEESDICFKSSTTIYLEGGNYSFAPGLKVYEDVNLTTKITLKYMLDTDGNLWRTNLFGELMFIQSNYC